MLAHIELVFKLRPCNQEKKNYLHTKNIVKDLCTHFVCHIDVRTFYCSSHHWIIVNKNERGKFAWQIKAVL